MPTYPSFLPLSPDSGSLQTHKSPVRQAFCNYHCNINWEVRQVGLQRKEPTQATSHLGGVSNVASGQLARASAQVTPFSLLFGILLLLPLKNWGPGGKCQVEISWTPLPLTLSLFLLPLSILTSFISMSFVSLYQFSPSILSFYFSLPLLWEPVSLFLSICVLPHKQGITEGVFPGL